MFGACIILAFFLFFKKWDTNELREDKIRSEEKIKQYQKDALLQSAITDSIETKNKALEAVIAYQKENPKIIEKKYVEVRNNVLSLSSDDKLLYLARRLSKKDSN